MPKGTPKRKIISSTRPSLYNLRNTPRRGRGCSQNDSSRRKNYLTWATRTPPKMLKGNRHYRSQHQEHSNNILRPLHYQQRHQIVIELKPSSNTITERNNVFLLRETRQHVPNVRLRCPDRWPKYHFQHDLRSIGTASQRRSSDQSR